MERFGIALKRARIAKPLNQEELGELAGIDPTYISKIETGRIYRPEDETIEKLAAALEMTTDQLLENVEPPDQLAEPLRRLRRRGGWSQMALSHRMGVYPNAIGAYERAAAYPSADTMIALVEALRCSPADERELWDAYEAERGQRQSGVRLPRLAYDEPPVSNADHPWRHDDALHFAEKRKVA